MALQTNPAVPAGSAAATRTTLIELELSSAAGPGWVGAGSGPVTVALPADTVRFDGLHLHFLTGDTVVRTVPRADVTALSWRGAPPRGRPRPGARNAGALWTDEERDRLCAEVLGDLSWTEIGRRHERTVSAVRREAVRLRLVDELGRRLDQRATAWPPGAGEPEQP